MLVSLTSGVFPISFYVVNENNNTFTIGTTLYTIEQGNPNANQFVALLNSAVSGSGVSFSYNQVKNKVTITGVGSSGIYGSALELIGFDDKTVYTGSSITSPYVVNLSGINYIFVESSSLSSTSNIDSYYGGGQSNVLSSVPLNAPFGSVAFYQGDNHKMLVSNKQLSYVSITILDEDRNTVNFNNQPWFIVIQIDFIVEKDMSPFYRSTITDYYNGTANDIIKTDNSNEQQSSDVKQPTSQGK
jgi:hypothetical protein